MSLPLQSQKFYSIFIFLAITLLCFVNLGGHPIYILDEAKNAEAAREMWMNKDWLVPTFNGELRTDKPPLHYWFMILSYQLFGVSAFSARLFSAVFGILTLVSTYHYTKKFIHEKMAQLTLLVLLSSIFFVQEFHLAVPDPYLIFFVSFALFNFYDFYIHRQKKAGFLFYTALGLGVLAKGPVAIALPGLIVLVFLIFKKDLKWKTLVRLQPFLGGILTLLIAFPWFYLIHKATDGAFTQGFFLEHNLQRFGSEMEGHGGWPFVTWAFVLLGMLPFSFFILQSLVQSWKKRTTHDFILFSWTVAVIFIVFFSISTTKLPNYPMPSYPFIAVLIGFYLHELIQHKIGLKAYRISLWVYLVIAILLPVAAFVVLTQVETQLFPARWASIYLVILPLGAILSFYFMKKKALSKSVLSLGLSAVLMTFCLFQFVYPQLLQESPLAKAQEIMAQHPKTIVYKGYDPAFLFNFERNFPVTDSKSAVLNFLQENPEAVVITKEKILRSDWEVENKEILVQQKALFENYTLVIFKLK